LATKNLCWQPNLKTLEPAGPKVIFLKSSPGQSYRSNATPARKVLAQLSFRWVSQSHMLAEPSQKLSSDTPTQTKMLAIVFSKEKFNQYTYGRHVKIQSDYKPLETILKKPLACALRRQQGIMMLQMRKDPPPGQHPIQSSPTNYRTPHCSGI